METAPWTIDDILKATGGELISGDRSYRFEGISIDSRDIGKGDLFVAIKGERHDGHHFLQDVISRGIRGVVVHHKDALQAVKEGGQGELTLKALPGETLLFSITRITPVSSQEHGSNTFRVEANLNEPSQQLRPGMEGVGKVVVGQRRLIWIWTHTLVDWLRLTIWAW